MVTLADINPGRDELYHLVKELDDDVWLARRLSDREPFIARRLTELEPGSDSEEAADALGLTRLLGEHGIDRAFAQLLNHENILSLAGVITEKTTSSAGEAVSQAWLVWDYPDAGTLSQLFHDRALAAAYTGRRYMPESLCWHVLRSVLGALIYLHEGSRPFCEGDATESWMHCVDDDWHPVLHGAVTAENIFFQHPRGTEEYGVCKLGNFSGAYVSGKVAGGPMETDTPAMGVVAGLRNGKIGSLDEIRNNLYTTGNPKTNTHKAYTVKDELWSLGAVVHQMMVGAPPPSPNGCETCDHECTHLQVCSMYPQGCAPFVAGCACDTGGCPHMPAEFCTHPKYTTGCPHGACVRKNVRFQDNLWRKDYSRQLIGAVLMMLQPGRGVDEWWLPGETGRIWDENEIMYREWLHTSPEGAAFHGVEDDLLARGVEVEKKRERELREARKRKQAERERVWGDANI